MPKAVTSRTEAVVIRARFAPPVARRREARRVAAMFGLDRGGPTGDDVLYDGLCLVVRPGEVVAVVGPSGAGKSVLLDCVARRCRGAVRADAAALVGERRPAVCLVGDQRLAWARRLELLSRCGLAEATALVTPAGRLSGGQRERLALARAIAAAAQSRRRLMIADEFAATLDYATAWVLARQLRKLASRANVGCLLGTSRAELLGALRPERVVFKPLGGRAELTALPETPEEGEPVWRIEPGRISDYGSLGRFHYLAGPPAAHKRVWLARGEQLGRWSRACGLDPAGVLVVSPPVLRCRGRNAALPRRYTHPQRQGLRRLNAEIECISRVVVHPAFRGLGLGVALVRHALATAETPLIEALAAMGQVHPLFDKAGMYRFGLFTGRRRYVYYLARRMPYTVAVGEDHRRNKVGPTMGALFGRRRSGNAPGLQQ